MIGGGSIPGQGTKIPQARGMAKILKEEKDTIISIVTVNGLLKCTMCSTLSS